MFLSIIIISQNINNSKTISESLYEKDTKYIEYLVTIDSNDRNKLIWKYPNEFSINFSPDSDTNFNDILESKKNNISYFSNVVQMTGCNIFKLKDILKI